MKKNTFTNKYFLYAFRIKTTFITKEKKYCNYYMDRKILLHGPKYIITKPIKHHYMARNCFQCIVKALTKIKTPISVLVKNMHFCIYILQNLVKIILFCTFAQIFQYLLIFLKKTNKKRHETI